METEIELFNIEEERVVCGHNDSHARALRNRYGVSLVSRQGMIKVIGEEESVTRAKRVVHRILEIFRAQGNIAEEEIQDLIENTPGREAEDAGKDASAPYSIHLPAHIRPKSAGQELYLSSICANDITFGIGPAGTGKTFLAVAAAISELKEGRYRKLVLVRPAVEAGEKLGFLPGDFQAKVHPYLQPLYDAIETFLDLNRVKKYLESDVIQIVPLAYMRGRTLDKSFIILDEAQNTTPKQMKMFLTRMGGGSKIVITGDVTQIDLPHNRISGLVHVLDVLQDVKGIGMVIMNENDIFRHPMVQRIVNAYEQKENHKKEPEEEPE